MGLNEIGKKVGKTSTVCQDPGYTAMMAASEYAIAG